MNGVLVIDKPEGPTSHDVVARVRWATGVRRIGHTGTLDPIATGVLPLVVGRATRLAGLLTASEKSYEAGIRLGAATPTYDKSGHVLAGPDGDRAPMHVPPPAPPAGIGRHEVEEALAAFRGEFWQVPPPFSAKKIGGVRAYTLARRHEPVEPKPVRVTVHRLDLLSCENGLAEIALTCSAGFYVRSLAHDLGQALGCGAFLERLRRVRSGEFVLDAAVQLETIETEGTLALARLIPPERLLARLPGVVLTERGAWRAAHGNGVADEDVAERLEETGEPAATASDHVRLLAPDGMLLGIAEPQGGRLLHPVIVLV